ncbi:MAG: hypothetical protein JW940_30905 [Polyangiaceae bacterium]|nr:hypothetical protein [Polyangiaceae bacterium]
MTVHRRLIQGTATVLAIVGTLVFPRVAVAGLPEMEDSLVGRANQAWFDQCPDGSTTGVACQGTVCGVDFTLDAAAAQRFITIDGNAWDLHSGAGHDFAVAGLLNTACNDSAAIVTSPIGMQNLMGLDLIRNGLGRAMPGSRLRGGAAAGTGGGVVTADPGPTLSYGGALELGSSGYYSGTLPIAYAHDFSRDVFANVNGALSYAILPEGGFTKFNALPSVGALGGSSKFSWGVGGYAPIAFSYTSISLIDYSLTAYDVGVGAVGVASAYVGRTQIAGGAVADIRTSSAAGTQAPMTALVRVLHPVSLVDAFGSVAIGSNPVYAGTTTLVARAGAEWGDWEFGYQLAIGTGNVSHMLGFMHRQKLRRREILERPATPPPNEPAAPEKQPAAAQPAPAETAAPQQQPTEPPVPAETAAPQEPPAGVPAVPGETAAPLESPAETAPADPSADPSEP